MNRYRFCECFYECIYFINIEINIKEIVDVLKLIKYIGQFTNEHHYIVQHGQYVVNGAK